jgi:twitching motility protein PilT
LGTNLRVRDAIMHGESEGKTFYDIMQQSNAFGMITFDQHLIGLYEQSLITQETAIAFASERGIVGRGIDAIKSSRGEATTDIEKLEIDQTYAKSI